MKRQILAIAMGLALAAAPMFGVARADEETKTNASGPYMQGLGEFMLAGQIHHGKLWFAGESGNWELAAYELDELKESLSNGAKFYPTQDDFAVATQMKAMIDGPLDQLDKAIDAKNKGQFEAAFTALTAGCTNCHAASKHAFIRIVKPATPAITNQNYAPK